MDTDISLFDPGPSQKNKRKSILAMPKSLPPEIEEGNIEYKLKLVNPSPSRFEHLVTQMKWRLEEGRGEAIYEIGVEDNGLLVGLGSEELDASMVTLNRMAERLGASITIIRESIINSNAATTNDIDMEINEKKNYINEIKLIDYNADNSGKHKNNINEIKLINYDPSNDVSLSNNLEISSKDIVMKDPKTSSCLLTVLNDQDQINKLNSNINYFGIGFKNGSNGECVNRDIIKADSVFNGIAYKCPMEKIGKVGSAINDIVNGMNWNLGEFNDRGLMKNDSHLRLNVTENLMHLSSNDTCKDDRTYIEDNESKFNNVNDVRKVLEILIRKLPDDQQFIDIRVAVLGGVDSGKSTTLGVLTQGQLDNGRGRARLNLFRHLHEIQTGRTSSISHEILGFDNDGNVYNHADQRTVEEIVENSTKVVSFIDLCGHHKYLRTTIYGLTGYSPDCAMLVVAANMGIVGTLKEHLGYTLALQVPAFMVVTKLDACKPIELQHTLSQLERLVRSPGCNRLPIRVLNCEDACAAADNFASGRVCPIIPISCVTGENVESLLKFLHVLPSAQSNQEREELIRDLPELQVDEIYTVPDVGLIVGGTVLKGTIHEGEILRIGPNFAGFFSEIQISSVHRNRLPCKLAVAGQTACVAIGNFDEFPVRKGQVLLSPSLPSNACFEFEADIFVLFHNKNICRGFQAVVHIGNVRQTAAIIKMNKSMVRMNEKAIVTFRFITRPEYIRVGQRMLFRQGRTKGMGQVRKITPLVLPSL